MILIVSLSDFDARPKPFSELSETEGSSLFTFEFVRIEPEPVFKEVCKNILSSGS